MGKIEKLKQNILAWYPFKEKSAVLFLTSKNEKEEQINTMKLLSEKHSKVKMSCREISELNNINEKYDYIVMLGTIEHAGEIIHEIKPHTKLLNIVKTKLKDDGIILMATDNRLGVKYLVGDKCKYCENIYDSLNNKYTTGRMFNKTEITNIIEECGFENYKFYYPIPNYEFANIIYTDDMLPDKNDSKINYNVIYDEGSLITHDETILLKQFLREGNFAHHTNSFLIEISNNKIMNDIKYVSFNNMRKEEYSLILKMNHDMAEKDISNKSALKHINDIKNNTKKLKELGFELAEEDVQNDKEKIIERVIKLPLLDSYITSLLKQNKTEEAFKTIDYWYNYIKEKLNADSDGNIKDGFIDLVFENTFYDEDNNSFIFFDQEWYLENIPLNFILYRAIKNLYSHNKSLNNSLKMEDMFKKYNIEPNELFEKLEDEFQEKVIDKDKREFYAKQYDYMITSEEIMKIISDFKRFDRDNADLLRNREKLLKDIKELQDDLKKGTHELDILRYIKYKFFK